MTTTLAGRIARQDDRSGHVAPIGSIVAYLPGYYTAAGNIGFTLFGPGSNTVAGINAYIPDNWRVCDGAAPNDAESPVFNSASRFLPDITDNRFIRGVSASGTTGGANNISLNIPQLPSHNHSILVAADNTPHNHTGSTGVSGAAHTHTGLAAVVDAPHVHSGTTAVAAATHSHPSSSVPVSNAPHSHGILRTDGSDSDDALTGQYKTGNTVGAAGTTETANAPHDHGASVVSTNNVPHTHGLTINTANAPHSHPINIDPNSAPHTHPVTVDNGNAPHTHPGSTAGNTGIGDLIGVEPQYVNVFYIMRIK